MLEAISAKLGRMPKKHIINFLLHHYTWKEDHVIRYSRYKSVRKRAFPNYLKTNLVPQIAESEQSSSAESSGAESSSSDEYSEASDHDTDTDLDEDFELLYAPSGDEAEEAEVEHAEPEEEF